MFPYIVKTRAWGSFPLKNRNHPNVKKLTRVDATSRGWSCGAAGCRHLSLFFPSCEPSSTLSAFDMSQTVQEAAEEIRGDDDLEVSLSLCILFALPANLDVADRPGQRPLELKPHGSSPHFHVVSQLMDMLSKLTGGGARGNDPKG
jgi:hypothetical protein